MIEGEIRREMTVDKDQQYQETFKAAANMPCQLKQRDDRLAIAIILCRIKKVHGDISITDVEEFAHVYSYPLLEYIGSDTYISQGAKKMG